jgi:hypothetical protein
MDFGKHKRKYGFYKLIRNITSHFIFCVCKIFHCINIFVTILPFYENKVVKKDIF